MIPLLQTLFVFYLRWKSKGGVVQLSYRLLNSENKKGVVCGTSVQVRFHDELKKLS